MLQCIVVVHGVTKRILIILSTLVHHNLIYSIGTGMLNSQMCDFQLNIYLHVRKNL